MSACMICITHSLRPIRPAVGMRFMTGHPQVCKMEAVRCAFQKARPYMVPMRVGGTRTYLRCMYIRQVASYLGTGTGTGRS